VAWVRVQYGFASLEVVEGFKLPVDVDSSASVMHPKLKEFLHQLPDVRQDS
jgi:hypothetical protein